MSVTITSTTDTPEQVAAATGNLKVDKVEQAPAPALADETSEASETSNATDGDEKLDAKDGDSDQKSEPDKPKKKGGFKKRIAKLSSKLSQKEQEVEYWRQEAMKNSKPKDEKVETQKADTLEKPQSDNFSSHEQYIEALTDWKVDQKEKLRESREKEMKLKTEFQSRTQTHVERVKEFQKTHDDFNELMEDVDDVPMSLTVQEVILGSDVGPELMYELAKNKKEFMRICALPSIAAARELGKIEARLVKTEPESKEIKKTKAPPPITPVSSKSSGISKSPDQMDYQEYKKWRSQKAGA